MRLAKLRVILISGPSDERSVLAHPHAGVTREATIECLLAQHHG